MLTRMSAYLYSLIALFSGIDLLFSPFIACAVGYSNYQIAVFAETTLFSQPNDIKVCIPCAVSEPSACVSLCEQRMKPSERVSDTPFFTDSPGVPNRCVSSVDIWGNHEVCIRLKTHEDCSKMDFPLSTLLSHTEAATLFVVGMGLYYITNLRALTLFLSTIHNCAEPSPSDNGHSTIGAVFWSYDKAIYVYKVVEAVAALAVGVVSQTMPSFDLPHNAVVLTWWMLATSSSIATFVMAQTPILDVLSSWQPCELGYWAKGGVDSRDDLWKAVASLSLSRVVVFTSLGVMFIFSDEVGKEWPPYMFVVEFGMLVVFVYTGFMFVWVMERHGSRSTTDDSVDEDYCKRSMMMTTPTPPGSFVAR